MLRYRFNDMFAFSIGLFSIAWMHVWAIFVMHLRHKCEIHRMISIMMQVYSSSPLPNWWQTFTLCELICCIFYNWTKIHNQSTNRINTDTFLYVCLQSPSSECIPLFSMWILGNRICFAHLLIRGFAFYMWLLFWFQTALEWLHFFFSRSQQRMRISIHTIQFHSIKLRISRAHENIF